MRTLRALAPAAVLLLAAAAAPAQAQASPFGPVAQDDAASGRALTMVAVTLGYVDANANGQHDPSSPAEPVYLDADNSRSVTYGDVRLTALGRYPAASTVDATNTDLALVLAPTGWIASTQQGAWVADLDSNQQVSTGDVRLSGTFGEQVDASASDRGQGLQPAQQATSTFNRVGYLDLDSDGRRDAAEPLYFDLDPTAAAGAGRVSPGDLRLTPGGPGLDDGPSRAEFDALRNNGDDGGDDGGSGASGGDSGGSRWGMPETFLLVLALVNLVGLALLFRRPSRPRNPFQ